MRQFIILLILAVAVFFGYSWMRNTSAIETLMPKKRGETVSQEKVQDAQDAQIANKEPQKVFEEEELAEKGATEDSLETQLRLGFGHALGAPGMPHSMEDARIWLKKAAAQKDMRAAHFLNIINLYTYDITPMRLLETTYADDLVKQAGRGDVESQALLGRIHMMDEHALQDNGMNKGRSWLTLAAKGGDVDSAHLLEVIDRVLEANPEDLEKIKAAAQEGDAKSQTILGIMYVHGIGGVAQDPKPARHWLNLAAVQEEEGAIEYLRFLNRELFRDAVLKRLRTDALRGENEATVTLAYVHLFGFWEVDQDIKLAKHLAEMAAKSGSIEGQRLLDFIEYCERNKML